MDADLVAQLDTRHLVPEVHAHLAVHDLAGPGHDALGPQPTALPLVVAAVHYIVERPDATLGEYPPQPRKALGDAGEEQIRDQLGGPGGRRNRVGRVGLVGRIALPARHREDAAKSTRRVDMDR